MKKLVIVSSVIVTTIILGAMGFLSLSETEFIVEKVPLRIAINVWPGYSYAFLAQELGYFEENGVDVELVLRQEYSETQDLFDDKLVDGTFQVYTDTLFNESRGISSKVVYVTDYSTSADVVVGTLEKVRDLKGKTIGIDGINTFSHMFVLKALEKNGISEDEVYFEIIPAHQILDALIEGKIDAGHTWDPTLSQSVSEGYTIICTAGDIPGIITDTLVFHDSVIQDRPEDIQAVVNSLNQAASYLKNNPEDGIQIISTSLTISADELTNGLNGVYLLDANENLDALTGDHETKSLMQTGKFISEYYLERGQISKLPNLDELIDASFVKNSLE